MHEAIIHIGTEKTGSTAIQNFLYKNEAQLLEKNIHFPYRSCGLISNYRLVLYSMKTLDPALVRMESASTGDEIHDHESFLEWKVRFSVEHGEYIKNFQANRKKSLFVYSSEHFHSRIHDEREILFLKDFLDNYFDKIRIVFYARRQDQLALSAHNTAIQGGYRERFDFSDVTTTGPYYDYYALANRWAKVFGDSSVFPMIYEKNRLYKNDVVRDFERYIGIKRRLFGKNDFVYEKSNSRLSYTAQMVLIEFNKLDDSDDRLGGVKKDAIRQPLINFLHGVKDEYGEILPPRSMAVEFYQHYKERNDALTERWLAGKGFSSDFSIYPEAGMKLPDVEGGVILSKALKECLNM